MTEQDKKNQEITTKQADKNHTQIKDDAVDKNNDHMMQAMAEVKDAVKTEEISSISLQEQINELYAALHKMQNTINNIAPQITSE